MHAGEDTHSRCTASASALTCSLTQRCSCTDASLLELFRRRRMQIWTLLFWACGLTAALEIIWLADSLIRSVDLMLWTAFNISHALDPHMWLEIDPLHFWKMLNQTVYPGKRSHSHVNVLRIFLGYPAVGIAKIYTAGTVGIQSYPSYRLNPWFTIHSHNRLPITTNKEPIN